DRIQAVADESWEADEFHGGIEDRIVTLAPLGDLVDAKTRDLIAEKEAALVDETFWQFDGPMVDVDGEERVGEDDSLSEDDVRAMDWYVEGVELTSSN